ncbi:MFS transporter [Catenulispora sp. NF23]|uniref:MFS transporter n=1 Tax=Catenulispora pinistramenti TaxID=2705254 RepID=A0ABS5KKN4_9ACTN|nr:MFS transporter [Catenulispora pinistramenti]MBS2533394.1 MFS transporter [Catenulispora pinistramenti]MBS2546592.1 MFS transporter [Catenulispora pinistramenti]
MTISLERPGASRGKHRRTGHDGHDGPAELVESLETAGAVKSAGALESTGALKTTGALETIERLGEPTEPAEPGERDQQRLAGGALILAGIILVAANLRLGVSSTGPLLDQLRDRLHLGAGVVTLLPTLWVVIFAFAGPAGSWLARRHGAGSVLAASLAVLVAGSAVRGIPDVPGLLAGSVLAGIGIALGNVLLPVVVRTYFPHRIGAITGIYSTMIALGSTVAAGIAVPLSDTLGGPSGGLEFWTIPALAGLALWMASHPHRRRHDRTVSTAAQAPHIPLKSLAKSKLAWAMTVAFGLQSMSGYVVMGWIPSVLHDHGMSSAAAGTVLSVTFAVNAPLSFIVPLTAARLRSQRLLAMSLGVVFALGFGTLIVAPGSLAYLAAVLIGVGMAAFPLVLTMIGLRGGTPAGTAALSAFSQSAGYLIAAMGPIMFGILGHALHSWTVPLAIMVVVVLAQGVVAAYVGSPKRGTLISESGDSDSMAPAAN